MLRVAGAEHKGQGEDKEPDNTDKLGEEQQEQQQNHAPFHQPTANLPARIDHQKLQPVGGPSQVINPLQSSGSVLEPGVPGEEEVPGERTVPGASGEGQAGGGAEGVGEEQGSAEKPVQLTADGNQRNQERRLNN